ncbi:SAM-dependent methyltransferase [Paenibacillus tritici]|uniref:SAM-dependent methyltransferase n=1 Tax=Paenibacillus tritici TaxID=1873425 RepID=UPI001BA74819|nr:SAM-dependent methyltransferase [Paenibacillus tritici]QUL58251.1 SAM-dependent methyltransferase [Paenibacillus tritici]
MLLSTLYEFAAKFRKMADEFDGTTGRSLELTDIIDEYTCFIMNPRNQEIWEEKVGPLDSREVMRLTAELREVSAKCVSIMEKYRALHFLNGSEERTEYFANIESGIEREFGSFEVGSDSRVVMVGAGAFPMTPMLISRRTNAEVLGIDIDEEAVILSNKVLSKLGHHLPVRLLTGSVIQYEPELKQATHIIFSSTVAEKYNLLDLMYPLTGQQVVVAMRYGDRIKSLFNYPMKAVDETKWKLAEQIQCPDQVFDVALYRKAHPAS